MVRRYSITEAEGNISHLVQEAEEGGVVELTRQGRPVAVVISMHDYERLSTRRKGFWSAYQDFAGNITPEDRALDDDALEGLRDRTIGRELDP